MDTATDDDFHDLDLASNITPFVDWDELGDLEMSSKSDDCLDEVFPPELPSDPLGKSERNSGPPVVLLSHNQLTDSRSGSDGEACGDLGDSNLDPDPGLDRDEVKYKRERGFYDVGMLNVDVTSLSNDTLQRMEDDSDHLNYLLHPDVKIEVLMAEQRKHMRIAQLLKLSQPPAEPLHPLQILRPLEDSSTQGEAKGMPVPPNTPRLAKLKPDHCWIKDIPDSPEMVPPESETQGPPLLLAIHNTESSEPTTSISTTTTTTATTTTTTDIIPKTLPEEQVSSQSSQQQPQPESDKKDSDNNSTGRGAEVHIVRQDVGSVSDSVSESGSDVSRNDHAVAQHYTKEDIPWNPG